MLSKNIRNLRKQKGFNQEELANRIHVVRQTISKWESGLSVPDFYMLINLASELGVSVSDLLGETIENSDENNLKTISDKLESINLKLSNQRIQRIKRIRMLLIFVFLFIVKNK